MKTTNNNGDKIVSRLSEKEFWRTVEKLPEYYHKFIFDNDIKKGGIF